jgi:hypothetical protein
MYKLRAEWEAITGDSFMVDVRPFHDQDDVLNGFLEVFKYAVKFADLSLDDAWHGYQTLSGRRLIASFGAFRGVDVPEDLTDEGLDDLPYVELLYRFVRGAGYSFSEDGPAHERSMPPDPVRRASKRVLPSPRRDALPDPKKPHWRPPIDPERYARAKGDG